MLSIYHPSISKSFLISSNQLSLFFVFAKSHNKVISFKRFHTSKSNGGISRNNKFNNNNVNLSENQWNSQKQKLFSIDRETEYFNKKTTMEALKTHSSIHLTTSNSNSFFQQKKFISTTNSLFSDYYSVLGVNQTASQEEIKKKWTEKAKLFHPDISKDKDAQTKFIEIAKAYDTLRDTEKRKNYDLTLKSPRTSSSYSQTTRQTTTQTQSNSTRQQQTQQTQQQQQQQKGKRDSGDYYYHVYTNSNRSNQGQHQSQQQTWNQKTHQQQQQQQQQNHESWDQDFMRNLEKQWPFIYHELQNIWNLKRGPLLFIPPIFRLVIPVVRTLAVVLPPVLRKIARSVDDTFARVQNASTAHRFDPRISLPSKLIFAVDREVNRFVMDAFDSLGVPLGKLFSSEQSRYPNWKTSELVFERYSDDGTSPPTKFIGKYLDDGKTLAIFNQDWQNVFRFRFESKTVVPFLVHKFDYYLTSSSLAAEQQFQQTHPTTPYFSCVSMHVFGYYFFWWTDKENRRVATFRVNWTTKEVHTSFWRTIDIELEKAMAMFVPTMFRVITDNYMPEKKVKKQRQQQNNKQ